MTMFYFLLFCFYRFISKIVESVTVRDACPSPASAPAAPHLCSGEWLHTICYPCMKQPNEVQTGTHVFVLNVFAFWLKYDMASFPGAGVSQTLSCRECSAKGLLCKVSCNAWSTHVECGLVPSREVSCSFPHAGPRRVCRSSSEGPAPFPFTWLQLLDFNFGAGQSKSPRSLSANASIQMSSRLFSFFLTFPHPTSFFPLCFTSHTRISTLN